jgi:hypothetical protein
VLDILFRCANGGDAVSVGILQAIGTLMARSVAGCAKYLDMGMEFDVVLVGSVTLKATCPVMLDTFMAETLRLMGKKVHFKPLEVPVAAGAVLWAMELAAGRPADDEMARKVTAILKSRTAL